MMTAGTPNRFLGDGFIGRLPFVATLACSAAFAAGETGPGWIRATEHAAFSPRDTAEDLVYGGKMWLSNGYFTGNVLTRDLWCSSDGATWTLVNSATPYDGYSEMVVFQDRMWAIKGSVWSSTDGIDWRHDCAETPFGVRGYGEAVVWRDKIWQLGSGEDVWASNDGVAWTCVTPHAAYGARAASAVVAYKDRLWLLGGRIDQAATPPETHYPQYTTFNDVWTSSDGAHWERVLEHAPWAARMWFVAKAYRDRLWIVGGFDNVHGANFGDVWYTENGVAWTEFRSEAVFAPRHEPTCYVYEDSLWVVDGNTWPVVNDVWRLSWP